MKSRKNRVNRLFGIAVGALVIYLAVSSMVLQVDISSYQNKLNDLNRQCAEQEIENQ